MAIFIEGCNVDFYGDIITCVPIRNRSGKKCPTIKVNFDDSRARIKLQKKVKNIGDCNSSFITKGGKIIWLKLLNSELYKKQHAKNAVVYFHSKRRT